MRMTPEDEVHFRVVAALRLGGVPHFHCPNQVTFPKNATKAQRMAVLSKRKRLGVEDGVADLIIVMPPPALQTRCPAALELKAPGGRASKAQREWLTLVASYGWATAVTTGLDASLEQLWAWGYQVPDIRLGLASGLLPWDGGR